MGISEAQLPGLVTLCVLPGGEYVRQSGAVTQDGCHPSLGSTPNQVYARALVGIGLWSFGLSWRLLTGTPVI